MFCINRNSVCIYNLVIIKTLNYHFSVFFSRPLGGSEWYGSVCSWNTFYESMNVLWMRNNTKSKNITGDRTLKSNSNINFIENLSVRCVVFVFQWKPPQWARSPWRGRQRTQHQWWRWVTWKYRPGLKVVTPWNVQKSHAGLRLIRICVLCVLRTGADWGHSQVWLRGPKSQRAVLQEGSLPVTVPASVWGLVGGPAQRRRWADSTSVHCGAGHVSGIYFNCEANHWIRFLVSVKSHSFSTQQTHGESQLRGSTAGQRLLLAQSLFMSLYFLQMPFILPFS